MLKTTLKIGSLVVVLMIVGTVAAQREAKKPADFSGRIAAISADGKTLTLESGGGRGQEPKKTDVTLTDKTKIDITGALKDLNRKLKVGDTASVFLEGGSAGIVQVNPAPDIAGKIATVSADGKTLTLEVPSKERGAGPMNFEIRLIGTTKMVTPVARGNEEAKPLPAQAGHFAAVWLQEGSKDTAAAVQITMPSVGGGNRGR